MKMKGYLISLATQGPERHEHSCNLNIKAGKQCQHLGATGILACHWKTLRIAPLL